jgi:ribonuclease D
VENLLTPDYVRRLMWEPPDASGDDLTEAVGARLRQMGARPWQIEVTRDALVEAIASPPAAAVVPLPDPDETPDETPEEGPDDPHDPH